MHAYDYTPGDTRLVLRPAWPFVIGYTIIMMMVFGAPVF